MSWVVDACLDVLLAQINAVAPGRNKNSDGSIGDAAHARTESDHNPNGDRVVRARDYTHDPRAGADMAAISDALRVSGDPRIKYVIFNRRIFSGNGGVHPWKWRLYGGSNSHDKHMHVSSTGPYHDRKEWRITMSAKDLLDADVVPNRRFRPDYPQNSHVRWEFAVTNTWDLAHAAATEAVVVRQELAVVRQELAVVRQELAVVRQELATSQGVTADEIAAALLRQVLEVTR